ncbi:MAG: hypothetical protein ABI155_02470 [Paralcaligenes sp.]
MATTATTPPNAVDLLASVDTWVATLPSKPSPTNQTISLPQRPSNIKLAARLASQVEDLDLLFRGLVERAIVCADPTHQDVLMRATLRCQQQAMRTTQALATLGVPRPVIFEHAIDSWD